MNYNNKERKLLDYHCTSEKDFHPWELRVKYALRGKDLINARENELVARKTYEKALFTIIIRLGDNPLQHLQDFDTAIVAWEKLQHRYAGQTMGNKLENSIISCTQIKLTVWLWDIMMFIVNTSFPPAGNEIYFCWVVEDV